MSAWTLCIDFGTAYSKAAAAPVDAWSDFDPTLVRPLMLAGRGARGNAFLLDSAVFVDDTHILFGGEAVARADELSHTKRMALKSFKTLLSVSDLERALNTSVPASIDPHRIFQMRDLIVLYLAFLTASIGAAAAEDAKLAHVRSVDLRYAAPAWRSGDSAGLHAIVVGLFGEAERVVEKLGPRLLSADGVEISEARAALDEGRRAPIKREMGLIFEASAAAAYTSIGLESVARHLIVVDMGAGTTDIAALARVGARIEDLPESRVTLKQAGDHIDRILANRLVTLSRAKTTAQQGEVWRAVMGSMRDFKETLSADGKAALRVDGRVLALNIRDLEREADFKAFHKSLSQAYDHGLDVLREHMTMMGAIEMMAVAVGGGAAAPFIQELIRKRPSGAGRIRVEARPATPDWAHAREFRGNLAPVFPQLAIAIGGALAPDTMLAARETRPTRRANARSGSPAERG